MPVAICQSCERAERYHNTAGATMPSTCAACGGDMVAAKRNYDAGPHYVPRGTSKGTRMTTCAACGMKRRAGSNNLKRVIEATIVVLDTYHRTDAGNYEIDTAQVPAGADICWDHMIRCTVCGRTLSALTTTPCPACGHVTEIVRRAFAAPNEQEKYHADNESCNDSGQRLQQDRCH